MRIFTALGIALLNFASSALAYSPLSADDAQTMQIEALADKVSERIHGRFDFMLEDPDIAVDQTTARGSVYSKDDCANVPIRAKRTDGTTVIKRVDVCD